MNPWSIQPDKGPIVAILTLAVICMVYGAVLWMKDESRTNKP